MGIKGLTAVINDNAPRAITQTDMKSLFGRKVAIDASMSIYQFLIAVRQQDGSQLMSDDGETTSHLMGLFYRTLRMVENDLKPCYVFDGKPPQLKSNVLSGRFSRREEAKAAEEEAKETGTAQDVERFQKRQVKVTPQHNAEARRLLTLMGIPWIEAPSEAEAQCAELCRAGLVYAAGSEDMDTLTFNSPILLRHLTFSEAKKMPIDVIKLDDVLAGLDLTFDKFVDFCMLCGCDYLDPIKGVGAKTALKLIREYGTIDAVLEHLNEKGVVPQNWPYKEAKQLFLHPDVKNGSDITLEWKEPDVEGLVDFLVKEKGFSEDRVRKVAAKLQSRLHTKPQARLEGFFGKAATPAATPSTTPKRKLEDNKETKSKKTSTKKTKK